MRIDTPDIVFERARKDFIEAADWVRRLLVEREAVDWEAPGIGDWDLRALVGHTSRALLTVEQYLGYPAEREEITSPTEYFRRTSAIPGADADEVLARGVAAGRALGADPAGAFSEIATRVVALIDGAGDPLLTCIAGGIRLSTYLPTRTFELVVHGIDVARATGADPAPPTAPLASAAALASELAVTGGDGVALISALTGRGTLGPGYTVLRG